MYVNNNDSYTVMSRANLWPDQIITFDMGANLIFFNMWIMTFWSMSPRGRFNIKMSSYQYRKSHCGDKMILWSSYLHSGISYTGKMASFYIESAPRLSSEENEMNAHSCTVNFISQL